MFPTRRAIIITSQTPNAQHLPGVSKDGPAVKQFLKSPNAGVWSDCEITTLNNPTKREVLYEVQNAIADYVYIHFSGHGITRGFNRRMICVTDGELQDIELLNPSPRQLITIDACGTRETRAAIGSVPWAEEEYSHFDGYTPSRALFDSLINESPYGKLIVHATQIGQEAMDTSKGGKFTNALLDVVMRYQNSKQNGILPVQTVIDKAGQQLWQQGYRQQPQIYYEGNLKVPYAIVNPNFIQPTARPKTQVQQSFSTPNTGSFVLTVALVALIAAALR